MPKRKTCGCATRPLWRSQVLTQLHGAWFGVWVYMITFFLKTNMAMETSWILNVRKYIKEIHLRTHMVHFAAGYDVSFFWGVLSLCSAARCRKPQIALWHWRLRWSERQTSMHPWRRWFWAWSFGEGTKWKKCEEVWDDLRLSFPQRI